MERDREQVDRLEEAGWRVLRVWEHEGLPEALRTIERALAEGSVDRH
jgi:G:T-mismatch repair DNA endonuclease (very short patch repair protein)